MLLHSHALYKIAASGSMYRRAWRWGKIPASPASFAPDAKISQGNFRAAAFAAAARPQAAHIGAALANK